MPADLSSGDAARQAVEAVLAVTPLDCAGEAYTGDDEYDMPIFGDPTPIAARQAAAVLRWAADEIGKRFCGDADWAYIGFLQDQAAEIEEVGRDDRA